MSANLVVDLGNNCQQGNSITSTPFLSGGLIAVGSGAAVGVGINMNNADTYCNLQVTGVSASGRLRIAVQCSDTDTSGSYTDPTSGLAALPGSFSSGGILWLNSGLDNGTLGPFISGHCTASGFTEAQGFQRTGTFVRAIALAEVSAQYAGALQVTFVSNLRTIGSGAGYTLAPSSGAVNV